MRRVLPVVLFVLTVACSDSSKQRTVAPAQTLAPAATSDGSTKIPLLGVDFLNGINLPWNSFSSDIGCAYEPEWFVRSFADIVSQGLNSVRFWVHAGGRCSPTYGPDGTPNGLPPDAAANLEDLLNRAQEVGLGVVVVLWSHDMANDSFEEFPVGHHDDIIRSAEKTEAYIEQAMRPLVERVDAHPALLAWEVINEPELTVEGIGNDGEMALVAKADLLRFVGQVADGLHRYGDKPVTVGAFSVESLVESAGDLDEQWWTDEALKRASGAEQASLDLLQVHYYDYQADRSPWDVDLPEMLASLGKPIFIGEYPLNISRGLTAAAQEARSMGYVGTMPWAYNDRCCGLWLDAREELATLGGS